MIWLGIIWGGVLLAVLYAYHKAGFEKAGQILKGRGEDGHPE